MPDQTAEQFRVDMRNAIQRLDVLLVNQGNKIDVIGSKVDETKEHVKETNGKVAEIHEKQIRFEEQAKADQKILKTRIDTALMVSGFFLTVGVVPLFGWLLLQQSSTDAKISAAIQRVITTYHLVDRPAAVQ